RRISGSRTRRAIACSCWPAARWSPGAPRRRSRPTRGWTARRSGGAARGVRALPLASAAVRCVVRRVVAWIVVAPGWATLACSALVALPLALARAGSAVGATLGPELRDPAVTRGALVGAALPCLAAGIAL